MSEGLIINQFAGYFKEEDILKGLRPQNAVVGDHFIMDCSILKPCWLVCIRATTIGEIDCFQFVFLPDDLTEIRESLNRIEQKLS